MKSVRKRDNERSLEQVSQEIEALKAKLQKLSEAKEEEKEESDDVLEDASEEEESQELDKDKHESAGEDNSDAENIEPSKSPKHTSENPEIPDIDSEFLEGLGKDPLLEGTSEVTIHPVLLKRWQHYISKGLEASEKEEIQSRNKRPVSFEPPELNPWMFPSTDPNAENKKKRDNHLLERQRLAASALTSLGGAMTMLSYSDEVDRLQFIEKMSDAAKLISQLMHEQTLARKAFLTPGFNKTTREILENAETDTLLFGQGLDETIAKANKLQKVAQDMKNPTVVNKYQNDKKFLNARGLGGKRPFSRNTGNFSASTQGRQKFFFKSRNQFNNPRANTQWRNQQRSNKTPTQGPR